MKRFRVKRVPGSGNGIIDMLLYKNGIPFRYEEKLVLGSTTIYPDFVIRHPVTGKYYYWEHFGMMDEEEYRNNACNKIRLYCENGTIPSIQLFKGFIRTLGIIKPLAKRTVRC